MNQTICEHGAVATCCDKCETLYPPEHRNMPCALPHAEACRKVGCGCLTYSLQVSGSEAEVRTHLEAPRLRAALSAFVEELRQVAKHGQDPVKSEEAQHWREALSDCLSFEGVGLE